jgi:tRNA dimethylallyltransferase
MNLPKIIVVCGPTATGKSALAVEIAKAVGGEIISADSRQVYRGMDLGTGKVTKKEMAGIPHHLLDVADPKRQFSVAQFAKKAQKVVLDITKRGKVPVVCGGTGFYIDTLIFGNTLPEVPPNPILRKELSVLSKETLHSRLNELDPERAETVDIHNPVRLIRAIEIATALGKVPTQSATPRWNALYIGLDMSDTLLKERIEKRLLARIRSGMVKEAQTLHNGGLSWKRMYALGLEYRYLSEFLQKRIAKKDMVRELALSIWQYVKRQRTWFKRNKNIVWFDPTKKATQKQVTSLVKTFLA